MNCQGTNGRVDIITPDTTNLFKMQDRIPVGGKPTAYREAMVGNWYDTDLSNKFFSAANIESIQKQLIDGVYDASNGQYIINKQPVDELKIIMRGTFLLYARNLPSNICGQVSELNEQVLDYAIPQVFGEAQGYLQYVVDSSTMYSGGSALMAPPVMASSRNKTLEFKSWF
jgi:hypothetical protein